jgi:hypothetical protein
VVGREEKGIRQGRGLGKGRLFGKVIFFILEKGGKLEKGRREEAFWDLHICFATVLFL